MEPKIVTAAQAGIFIKSKNIEIEFGKAYNVYACGCALPDDKDPKILAYFPEKKVKNRSCSKHQPSKLLGKYKICVCGVEYFSGRVQESARCAKCAGSNGQGFFKPKIKKHFKVYNGIDVTRWNCKDWEKCGNKAIDENLDFRPCKDCPDFEIKHGNHDALSGQFRNRSSKTISAIY